MDFEEFVCILQPVILVLLAIGYIIQKIINSEPIIINSKSMEKEIDDITVLLLYILSFFIPLAGFIVGAIYASKNEKHYKHVGKNCLIFSVINIILGLVMAVLLFA